MFDIASQRFYGAKSEPVDAIKVVASRPVEDAQWKLLDVTHGTTTDTYQVLLNADLSTDVLHTDAGATAYLAALPQLGEVHGERR